MITTMMITKRNNVVSVFSQIRFATIISLLLVTAGCGEPVDPRIAALKQKFVLTNPPEGERTVSSIRKAILKPEEGTEATPELDVVIRGRINAGELPPWESGKTAFMLTDATGHTGDSEHDPHTCPYCSENLEDYLVQVSFRDEQGELFQVDSRQAFGVQEKQLLLIQGRARVENDMLQVDATGLYFAKPKPKSAAAETSSQETEALPSEPTEKP